MLRSLRLGLILAIFCILSAGSLAFVYLLTAPRIEINAKLNFKNSLSEVLTAADSFHQLKDNVYEGMRGKERVGMAVAVSPRGYSGPISMLIGIDREGKVVGITILNQRETPGLGANIVKASFLNQFKGKSLQDQIEPKKDIDAITGATISSRGVCSGVKQALQSAPGEK